MAKLPREVRRRLPNGGKRVIRNHLLTKLPRTPNQWMTPTQCWGYMTVWLALRGNTYAVVMRGDADEPTTSSM